MRSALAICVVLLSMAAGSANAAQEIRPTRSRRPAPSSGEELAMKFTGF